MRITLPTQSRQLGPICIMQQIDVLELESRPTRRSRVRPSSASASASATATATASASASAPVVAAAAAAAAAHPDSVAFPNHVLEAVFEKMVIIVPCKDEPVKTIQNVLRGIPPDCAVILVSNCSGGYRAKASMLEGACRYGREAVLVHQKYRGAAAAFDAVGVPELLDRAAPGRHETKIRDGKGEGMYLGIAMARTFFPDREYVGFVDADNQVPGSVNEYCRVYAAGFTLSKQYCGESGDSGDDDSEHVMVRISWPSKPKVRDGEISFDEPEGRSSRVVNSFLNRLFAEPFGDASKFITTGNAGEHAMTMDMALSSRWANGYAIETYQFMDPFLRAGSSLRETRAEGSLHALPNSSSPVRILQIGTVNPHFHRQGNDVHILRMWAAGLGAIWHSLGGFPGSTGVIPGVGKDTIADLKSAMKAYALENGGIGTEEDLPQPRVYPAMDRLDFDEFENVLMSKRYLGEHGAPLFFGFDSQVE
ncbi:mannosyl-3-phosphoglycerate synthase [Cladorrhinum samala]|uniref:Mannosyl-3-phosphoglycerate synthase n=1 Tax=Cladorrhinum samala TaxID=585594 RepID=A0AAV9HW12_9PEZI|nr:mannosyl-3-phosphoglycerate synthase [Cladorrhinum samala]